MSANHKQSNRNTSSSKSSKKSKPNRTRVGFGRREFLGTTAAAAAVIQTSSHSQGVDAQTTGQDGSVVNEFTFTGPDSLSHPKEFETYNPGYWQIRDGKLRRRLRNYGDRARKTGFPYHAETSGQILATDYDPSLPAGILYSRNWNLGATGSVVADFVFMAPKPAPNTKPGKDGRLPENPDWRMFQQDYGFFGIAFGAKSLFESYQKAPNVFQAYVSDSGYLHIIGPTHKKRKRLESKSFDKLTLNPGDQIRLSVDRRLDGEKVLVTATARNGTQTVSTELHLTPKQCHGFVGVTARGLVDFAVERFTVNAPAECYSNVSPVECFACYALGDTLRQHDDGKWQVRFVSLFATNGEKVEIRVSKEEKPSSGWSSVPVSGQGKIVNNDFRRNTAAMDVVLPSSPAESDLFYTVWKDGIDVTADTRIGTGSVGPGTGMVGDVPRQGNYVGKLPRLQAPYRMCGLSCHAISNGLQIRDDEEFKVVGFNAEWLMRDQPSVESYQHLAEYDFQIMVWEDDVWYMELEFYPPSVDDAYRIVTNSICGPTSRWQMMRHWNVINPGDHDYGMDDVKGPEQLAIRRIRGLGQDTDYLRRNFQTVHHLTTGEEEFDATSNPKKWRAWKMPNRDFTFIVLDSRLWRSSQDVDMWDDSGWGAFKSLYDRTDPTRSLLGEEQFGWLQEQIATDSSPLICLTGINGMHTIWGGAPNKRGSDESHNLFNQRDRVTADYAGWVKAGADRVLELLGSRPGVVSVYGDVHVGCLMTNEHHRVIECSFGPIGRNGGRRVIPGFGPTMKDTDGRTVEIGALYHSAYADAKLTPADKSGPYYWNFLEMHFDPRPADPEIELRIRNLIDPPSEKPRGGGSIRTTSSRTGRQNRSVVNSFETLTNADVRIATENGIPLLATRSDKNGHVAPLHIPDVAPGTRLIATCYNGEQSIAIIVETS